MLLTVERVAQLRHVDLFSSTPDRVLAGVATVLDEVEFPAGSVLMREGAHESWLFILVDGQVEVSRSDRRVMLGPGDVVGEMQVLDSQPRSATVTALTAVHTFKLSKAAFEEAVRTRPEVALGVIAELCRRLRETHQLTR